MNAACIDIKTVAALTGEDRRRVWERIDAGEYIATKQKSAKGGPGGESYLVAVSSLPTTAQIIYMQQNGSLDADAADTLGLTAYRERFGEAGLRELLGKQRACQEGLAVRALNAADVVEQLTGIAEDHGTTLRTLYRWMDAYEARGLEGIMRAMKRKDAGTRPSMCPAAYKYAYGLYMNQVKRTTATIYKKLEDMAKAQGAAACKKCIHNEGTKARAALMLTDEINHYPACTDPEKTGMRIPACRQTLSRILAAIPEDEKTLARRGKKAWKDDHMVMAMRAKPEQVNEVWFGDHHQMDAFVLDKNGHPLRPWLTMWYDAATGCPVGWVLCENPNTQTIIEAFNRAVAHTRHSPFYGVPRMVYVDNGKDYRSKLFETGVIKERDLGFLNGSLATNSVLQLLNIQVTHALPYQGWSKPVERFFGTLEDIWIREVPGWCGDSPSERPEDFSRQLRLALEHGQLWTMDQFYEYLRDTAFPEYIERPHQGYDGQKPIDLYKTLPRARDDQPSWDMLNVLRNNRVERRISQQGVRFQKETYWDDEMIGLAGKTVTVLYDEADLSTVGIVLEGRFLCEAEPVERLRLVGEDPEKVAEHMAVQKRQYKDTVQRIRRASRSSFFDEVDAARNRGTFTTLEYEKAATARKNKRAEQAERKRRDDVGEDAARIMFMEHYEKLKANAR